MISLKETILATINSEEQARAVFNRFIRIQDGFRTTEIYTNEDLWDYLDSYKSSRLHVLHDEESLEIPYSLAIISEHEHGIFQIDDLISFYRATYEALRYPSYSEEHLNRYSPIIMSMTLRKLSDLYTNSELIIAFPNDTLLFGILQDEGFQKIDNAAHTLGRFRVDGSLFTKPPKN